MIGFTIIDRYVFREIAVSFLFCFAVFLLTGVIAGFLPLLQRGLEAGLQLTVILFQVLINSLPNTLVTVLPLSMMIGILLGLGRMAADNEIAAMKSSGISVLRLLPPVALMGIIGFGLSLWCTLSLIPRGIGEGHRLIEKAGAGGIGAAIEERTFFDRLEGLVLYVETMDPGTGVMTNVFLRQTPNPGDGETSPEKEGGVSRDRKGKRSTAETITIVAKKGRVSPDPQGKAFILELRDGTILRAGPDGCSTGSLSFRTYVFRYDLAGARSQPRGRSLEEMSIAEIRATMREWELDKSPQNAKLYERSRRFAHMLITQRFTHALASLVLALFAFPLGVLNMGTSRLNNVSAGLLAIFAYYAMTLAAERVVRSGLAPPELVLPAPAVVFMVAGAYFTRCVRLERVPWVVRLFLELIRKARRSRT